MSKPLRETIELPTPGARDPRETAEIPAAHTGAPMRGRFPSLHDDPHKILVIGSPPDVDALGAEVRAARLPVHAVTSEPTYLEILPPGISKGTALPALLSALGLSPAEVVAVGDNWNDLEMIEAAGLGVAMGHAPAGVRARADFVIDTSGSFEATRAQVRAVLDALAEQE